MNEFIGICLTVGFQVPSIREFITIVQLSMPFPACDNESGAGKCNFERGEGYVPT